MRLFIFCLMLIGCLKICIAQEPSIDKSSSYAFVDTLALEFLQKTKVPGLSITVNRDGNLIYSKGFGFADLEQGVKMLPSTQNRAASVSKVITATALGKLASEGKVDFDAQIGRYIPELKEALANLTVRQVAGHTAGIQHRPANNRAKRKSYLNTQKLIELVEATSLQFEPGTAYKYSTLAYNLLAGVIEGASGKRFTQFLKEDIFAPLDMNQSFPEKRSEFTEKDAKMYRLKKGKRLREKKPVNGSYKLPGAGFRSTSEDLAKMMNAYSNGYIDEKVVKDMFKSDFLQNGTKTNVGIAWRLNYDMEGRATIEHAGSWQGARTVIIHYPEEKLTVSMMINATCVIFIEETAQIIAQQFFHENRDQSPLLQGDYELAISHNKSDGTTSALKGKWKSLSDKKARLQIDTDIQFLQDNKVYSLGIGNHYALSTEFGLLYLYAELNPSLTGKLYLYQVLNDTYHMRKGPIFNFEAVK